MKIKVCYSAVAENLKEFKGITLLADIGNGTMNLMYLNNGRLVEQFGKYNPERTIFNHDIRANAKGYEYYCYMLLRHQNQRK